MSSTDSQCLLFIYYLFLYPFNFNTCNSKGEIKQLYKHSFTISRFVLSCLFSNKINVWWHAFCYEPLDGSSNNYNLLDNKSNLDEDNPCLLVFKCFFRYPSTTMIKANRDSFYLHDSSIRHGLQHVNQIVRILVCICWKQLDIQCYLSNKTNCSCIEKRNTVTFMSIQNISIQ